MTTKKKIPFEKKIRILCYCIRNGYDEQLTAQHFHIPLHYVRDWLAKINEDNLEALIGPRESVSKNDLDRAELALGEAFIALDEKLEELYGSYT